jgi:hypothetical protein
MKNTQLKRFDRIAALVFIGLTILLLVLAFADRSVFDWAYARHQNQLSWYIRPLFIIPFCFFAYKRCWGGIFGTIFLLLTSMFWFSRPDTVSEQVRQFLQMEMEWLRGNWTFGKVLMTLLVPISLVTLGFAFWKRSLWFGISVIVFIALAKLTWSVAFGGESGKSIFVPAILGLLVCVGLIVFGFLRLEKKKKQQKPRS